MTTINEAIKNLPKPYYQDENVVIYNADCREILPLLSGIDSVVTDPPYALTNKSGGYEVNSLTDILLNLSFPKFKKLDASILEDLLFLGIPLDGSDLSRFKFRQIVKSGVGVPESPVNFKGNVYNREEEINAGSVSTVFPSQPILPNAISNPSNVEFLGDYVLDFRDALNLPSGNVERGGFCHPASFGFALLVTPVCPASGNSPLTTFLMSGSTSIGYNIGGSADSLSQSQSSSTILASGGTVDSFMLRFDLARGAVELLPADRTFQSNLLCQFIAPKLIGAIPRTSCLPAEFKPSLVRIISDSANGAYSFNLWLHKDLLEKTKVILSQTGFMGKEWDNHIAFRPDTWLGVFSALKCGGHLLSFGGGRTYHRIACAIEDSGFEIREMVEWIFGQGFPKSLNVGKQMDKMAGAKREVVGTQDRRGEYDGKERISPAINTNWREAEGRTDVRDNAIRTITVPATEDAKKWEGWGTALKPSHEPICLARKPLEKGLTVAENVLKLGTGGINIDGCRIPTNPEVDDKRLGGNGDWSIGKAAKTVYEGGYAGDRITSSTAGRFPANLIHDGSEEVVGLFPNTAPAKQSMRGVGLTGSEEKVYGKGDPEFDTLRGHNDNGGSAARFFYCAKASRSERDEGCDEMPDAIGGGMQGTADQTLLTGSGNERNNVMKNNHPTVKPLALMQYLIKLITPPDGIVLDPFMGSGSTLVAARKLGFKAIGIELNEKYCEIAVKRILAVSKESAPKKEPPKAEAVVGTPVAMSVATQVAVTVVPVNEPMKTNLAQMQMFPVADYRGEIRKMTEVEFPKLQPHTGIPPLLEVERGGFIYEK